MSKRLMLCHLEWCCENFEAIKQPTGYNNITNFFMKQYSFKNAECSIQNNISTFCQVADQHLKTE
jgi:enhancing lycopene biosynthesis protein 2